MSLTHADLLTLHDKAYEHGYSTRIKAADDMLFAWVTQWDDTYLSQSNLGYRGEFNIIRKAVRRILTDLTLNAVNVDFEPVDGTGDDSADIIDGMYRADMRNNTALEATKNCRQEAVTCGVGAWELRNEYKTSFGNDDKQVIRRHPLYEANNNIMWDPNAKLLDKSDAKYVSCLIPYSEDGYKDLVKELTGEDDINGGDASFAFPEISYVFPWISEDKKIYITRFYYRERKKVKYLTFEDMFKSERTIMASDFKDQEDSLLAEGYELVSEKTIDRFIVTRYIASGGRILEETIVPGEEIPVVPMYGERAFVEGEETYEGVVRLAKDPQRLRNFQMSYLADIVSRSPREKPIFTSQQINGFEDMYEESGADNDFPYLLQNAYTTEGQELPLGPVGAIKAPEVPPALMISLQETRAAVDDVVGGEAADINDIDLSGKAINALNKRLDMQSFTYQDNAKFAMRREGEIYASMARDIYDTDQEVVLVKEDGTKSNTMINHQTMNFDTMQTETKNDMGAMIFDVYASIGPTFESMKEENRAELKELLNGGTLEPEEHTIILNEYLTMIDGSGFKDIRKYSRDKLIKMGVKQPEGKEEEDMLKEHQEAQQNQETPEMINARAAMMDSEAKMLEQKNREQERNIAAEKVMGENQNKSDRLATETQLKVNSISLDQQKVNNARLNDIEKNSIALTKIEVDAGLELSKQNNENKRELERSTSV